MNQWKRLHHRDHLDPRGLHDHLDFLEMRNPHAEVYHRVLVLAMQLHHLSHLLCDSHHAHPFQHDRRDPKNQHVVSWAYASCSHCVVDLAHSSQSCLLPEPLEQQQQRQHQ
jgi:hypothetical protein